MWLFYDLFIILYGSAIRLAALFNPRARNWVKGRSRPTAPTLYPSPNWGRERPDDRQAREGALAWFHCASLGEFEQGRPLMEAFRKEHPDWKILLTFFSPSGYEIRKNWEGADAILYLPLDTPRNVRRFIRTFKPTLAVFVKYEFWFRYIDRLHQEKIPIYLVSGIFRPQQHFFRWYGAWSRKQLKKFTHFFVQDGNSSKLLDRIGITNHTVSGDTRFDRVVAIAAAAKPFPEMEKFASGKKVFLAGSTWPADEALVLELMEKAGEDVRFIIAPHVVGPQRIEALCNQVVSRQSIVVSHSREISTRHPEHSEGSACVTYSNLSEETAAAARILIIDGIGYLSHLYQYATVAYIGGGFGTGIHNILEAATFGKPVIFGPNYGKFREAVELVELGGAFPVNDQKALEDICNKLLNDEETYRHAAGVCKDYVARKCGATEIILQGLKLK